MELYPVLRIVMGAGFLLWALQYDSGPVKIKGEVRLYHPSLYAFATTALLFDSVFELMRSAALLYFITIVILQLLARFFEWRATREVTFKEGSARWGAFKELKRNGELNPDQTGTYWGMEVQSKQAIFTGFVSNILCMAPSGSGKSVGFVVTNILTIMHSKFIVDLKPELVFICKQALENRGEKVVVLNPAGIGTEQLGETAQYSVLILIVDDLYQPGGIQHVLDDLRELSRTLVPEPNDDKPTDDTFWREGARRLLAIVIIIVVLLDEHHATLENVARLLDNRALLLEYFYLILGYDKNMNPLPQGPLPIEMAKWEKYHEPEDVAKFADHVRAQCDSWATMMTGADIRTFESFLLNAQQALAVFTGKVSSAMQRSTVDFNELKDGKQPVTIFVLIDSSRMEVYQQYLSVILFCLFTTIKRHPNKQREVFTFLDECTNYQVPRLPSLLTYGRGYGLRLMLIFQDLSAFEKMYGSEIILTRSALTQNIENHCRYARQPICHGGWIISR